MNREELALKLINESKKIGLVSHIRMDLDAFGSVLGIQEVLKGQGKEVVIFSAEELSSYVKDFEPETDYKPTPNFEPIDLLIITDVSDLGRIAAPNIAGDVKNLPAIVIDHHASEPSLVEGFIYFIEQATAASEIAYKLFKDWRFEISKKAAAYFCMGILGDTNDRKFTNTTDEAKEIVAEIFEKYGDDIYARYLTAGKNDRAHKQDFYEYCLKKAIKSQNHDATLVAISNKELEKFGMMPGIGSQVANFIEEHTDGAAFVFTEMEEDVIKASMRSNKNELNVRKIAESFGGGGHNLAAGFMFEGSLQAIVDKFL